VIPLGIDDYLTGPGLPNQLLQNLADRTACPGRRCTAVPVGLFPRSRSSGSDVTDVGEVGAHPGFLRG
jgi:hypothetical protein